MAQDSVGSTSHRNRNRPAFGRFAARGQGGLEPVDEGSQIVAHLDTIGARRFTLVIPQWPPQWRPSASLYGYDLSVAPAGLDTVVPREHNPRCPSVGAIFPIAGLLSWNSSTR